MNTTLHPNSTNHAVSDEPTPDTFYRMVIVSKKFNTTTGEYTITTIYGNLHHDKYGAGMDIHNLRYNAYQKNYLVDSNGETLTISTPEEILTITIELC